MTERTRLADLLLGCIVAALVGWSGVGTFAGGWIAGRRAGSPARGVIAGVVGALPWAALVYLASAGAIDPVGYHEGVVHVGINPADPALLAFWQEVALAGLVGGVLVAAAVAGGLLASGSATIVSEMREDRSTEP